MCSVEIFCYKVSLNDVLLCANTRIPTISPMSDSLSFTLTKTEMGGANLTLRNVLRAGRVISRYKLRYLLSLILKIFEVRIRIIWKIYRNKYITDKHPIVGIVRWFANTSHHVSDKLIFRMILYKS